MVDGYINSNKCLSAKNQEETMMEEAEEEATTIKLNHFKNNVTTMTPKHVELKETTNPNNRQVPLFLVCGVLTLGIVAIGILWLIVNFIRKRRLNKKETGHSGDCTIVKVPSQAGVIQAEMIEFVLPYTSAEVTEEEASEQEPSRSTLTQISVSNNNGGVGLLTIPQQIRRVKVNSIAPALYLSSEGEEEQANWFPANMNLGKVGFSIRFLCKEQLLQVKIIGVKGLATKRRKSTHTHIKVTLLPEKSHKFFTKVQKNTVDPMFNEEFEFAMKPEETSTKILKITTCDFDKFSRRIALGHVFFPLKNLPVGNAEDDVVVLNEMWKNLYPKHLGNEEVRGEISLSLCYNMDSRTLHLGVHKVKNLNTFQDEKDIACLYVKLTLHENGKIIKSKKTGAKKKTLEPDFEETFNIRIARKRLNDVVCSISVCSRNRYGTRKVIGRTQVGPYTHVSGPGADHWSDALQSPDSTVTQWHTLR